MSAKTLRWISAILSVVLLFTASACVKLKITKDNLAVKLFKNRETVCFSERFSELSAGEADQREAWRQGMVSGNGVQGYITSGAPFSDSMIFQHRDFLLPAPEAARNVDFVAPTDEEVRQAIVNGETYACGEAAPAARRHPGGSLRIDSRTEEKQRLRDYLRYTDYETGETGVRYNDNTGMWERASFTSFADDAVFTSIGSPAGKRLHLTLSFDDPSLLAGYGGGAEKDCLYKTWVSPNADCIALIAHDPETDEEDGGATGWATVSYVITDGGTKTRAALEDQPRCAQNVTASARGIRIDNAYAVYLITRSVPLTALGGYEGFAATSVHREIRALRREAKALAEKYAPNGYFDYSEALDAHLQLYRPQFDRVSLTLGDTDNDQPNEKLLKAQRDSDKLNASLLLREYFAARYALLCCGGAPRGNGAWTGGFSDDEAGAYAFDGGLSLQTAALSAAALPHAAAGYASFLLRQAPVWEAYATAVHGFENAVQAPRVSDGVTADADAADPTSRYYNAGAAQALRVLFDVWQTGTVTEIPAPDKDALLAVASVLSLTDEPLDEDAIDAIAERGSMDLLRDVLLPLLLKNANYWLQLLTPAYYTTETGAIRYDAEKESLSANESWGVLPGVSPGGAPDGYGCPAAANAAADIAACRDSFEMLLAAADAADADVDTAPFADALTCLPAYTRDGDGAATEWATTDFRARAGDDASRYLACVWPFSETKTDAALAEAAAAALKKGRKDRTADSLVRDALCAARLEDNALLTARLHALESGGFRYDSLMTDLAPGGNGGFRTDLALGFLGIVHEALLYSAPGEISLLPCVPLSGFNVGSISNLPTRTGATVTLMSWDLNAKFVIADITSPVAQTVLVTSPISDDTEILDFVAGQTHTVQLALTLEVEPQSAPAQETAAPTDPEAEAPADDADAAETEAVPGPDEAAEGED